MENYWMGIVLFRECYFRNEAIAEGFFDYMCCTVCFSQGIFLTNQFIFLELNLYRRFLLKITFFFKKSLQNKLLSIAEADGILYTESKVYSNETSHVGHPTVLVSKFVRAAHIYNIVFSHIRQNFAISGLVSFVQVLNYCICLYWHKNIPLI